MKGMENLKTWISNCLLMNGLLNLFVFDVCVLFFRVSILEILKKEKYRLCIE